MLPTVIRTWIVYWIVISFQKYKEIAVCGMRIPLLNQFRSIETVRASNQ